MTNGNWKPFDDKNGDAKPDEHLLDQSIFDLDPHFKTLGNDEAFELLSESDSNAALLEADEMADTQLGFTLGTPSSGTQGVFCNECGRFIPDGQAKYPRADGYICHDCDEAAYAAVAGGMIGKNFAAPVAPPEAAPVKRSRRWPIILAATTAVAMLVAGGVALVKYSHRPDLAALQRQADEQHDASLRREYQQLINDAGVHAASDQYAYAVTKIRSARSLLAQHSEWVPDISASQLDLLENHYNEKMQAISLAKAKQEVAEEIKQKQQENPLLNTRTPDVEPPEEPSVAAPQTVPPSAPPAIAATPAPAMPAPAAPVAPVPAPGPAAPAAPDQLASASPAPRDAALDSLTGGLQQAQNSAKAPPQVEKLAPSPKTPVSSDDFASIGSNYLVSHDLAAASRSYLTALKLDSRNQRASVGLALVSYFRGNTGAAINALEEIHALHPTRLTTLNLASMYQATNIMRSSRLMYDYLTKANYLDPQAFDYYIYAMWQTQFTASTKSSYFWKMAGFYSIYEQQLRIAHNGGNFGPDVRLWGHDWVSADEWRSKMGQLGEARAQFGLAKDFTNNRVAESRAYDDAIRNYMATQDRSGLSSKPTMPVDKDIVKKALDPQFRLTIADAIAAARYKMYEAQRGINAAAPPMPTEIPVVIP